MVCRNCGRNNPEGLASCFSCGMPLSRDLTAQQPVPYYGEAYPMPAPGGGPQSAGFFSGGGERNIVGLIAAVIYALCVLPVYINIRYTVYGLPFKVQEGRLINGWSGLAVIAIAVFAGIMAYIGNNAALTAAGGLAVAHTIYKAITIESAVNELRDEMISMISEEGYLEELHVSFGKGMGFWMLFLASFALLITGIVSLVMEKHDPLAD